MPADIFIYPDPVLTTPCEPVGFMRLGLAEKLLEICDGKNVLGIAAPQIGVSFCVFAAKIGGRSTIFVNPRVQPRNLKMSTEEESCLSLPGYAAMVRRFTSVTISYTDEHGRLKRKNLTGLEARVVQHETDHLKGQLILPGHPFVSMILRLGQYGPKTETPDEIAP